VSKIQKEQIQSLCRISNLEAFYTYLQGFLQELNQGGMMLRIKKHLKKRFMEKEEVASDSEERV
jgi:hypothetical protein